MELLKSELSDEEKGGFSPIANLSGGRIADSSAEGRGDDSPGLSARAGNGKGESWREDGSARSSTGVGRIRYLSMCIRTTFGFSARLTGCGRRRSDDPSTRSSTGFSSMKSGGNGCEGRSEAPGKRTTSDGIADADFGSAEQQEFHSFEAVVSGFG